MAHMISDTRATIAAGGPRISHHRLDTPWPVDVRIARFKPADSRIAPTEWHFTLEPTEYAELEQHRLWLAQAYRHVLAACDLSPDTAVFHRLFCSDITNQISDLRRTGLTLDASEADPFGAAVSHVGQPPAQYAKLALWAYHIHDPQAALRKTRAGHTLQVHRPEHVHHWTTGLCETAASTNSHDQTHQILVQYLAHLQQHRLTLSDHVMRTWFFLRDIDVNYHGLVQARKALFAQQGLTADTHYIASSGIGGDTHDHHALLTMDAYAIAGLRPAQVQQLCAPEYLSPTHMYGVTFERGTSIAYRDRTHSIISGTASIDPAGQIMHRGDVKRQLDRTLTNISALLARSGSGPSDVASSIVYLRDRADQHLIMPLLRERLGDAPFVVVQAPVCRPGWLVEIECLAVRRAHDASLPPF